MNNSAPTRDRPQVLDEPKVDEPRNQDLVNVALVMVPFLIAVIAGIVYNIGRQSSQCLVFDSVHYFQSTALLYQCLCGHLANQTELARNLILDGPTLPLAGALFSAALQAPPSAEHLQPLITLQCILHGISSSMVFLLTRKAAELGFLLRANNVFTPSGARAAVASPRNVTAVALVTAIAFALNPSALIACGRYLTETMTTTLLLGLVVISSHFASCAGRIGREKQSSKFTKQDNRLVWFHQSLILILCGITIALLGLTKSALLPAAAIITLATVIPGASWRSVAIRSALVAAGSAIVMLPWATFTANTTGQIQLLPNRLPGWNIALGSDVETDGWSAMPVPALLELNCYDKPLNILHGIYSQHPHEFVGLSIRKVVRLFSVPWNDFGAQLIPSGLHTIAHQFVLLSAVCAVLLLVATVSKNNWFSHRREKALLQSMCFVAVAFLAHLVFIPFESIPRYAFSATPFCLILSSLFLCQLSSTAVIRWLPLSLATVVLLQIDLVPWIMLLQFGFSQSYLIECTARSSAIAATLILSIIETAKSLRDRQSSNMLALLAVSTAVCCIITCFAFVSDKKNTGEWQCTLSGSQSASRVISFDPGSRGITSKPDWAAILVDGDQNLQHAILTCNGIELNSKCVPIYRIPNSYRYQQTLLHTFQTEADAENISADEMRQWRIFPVPIDQLVRGTNLVSVTAKPGYTTTIYGDYKNNRDNRLLIPSLESFAVCKVQSSSKVRDGRPLDPIGFPSSTTRSSLSTTGDADLSPSPGTQKGDYRIFLLLAYRKQSGSGSDCALNGMTFSNRFVTLF